MKFAMMRTWSVTILPWLTIASDTGNSLLQIRTVRQRTTINLDEDPEPHLTIKGVPFYLNEKPGMKITALQMEKQINQEVVFKDVPKAECQKLQDEMDNFVKCCEGYQCTVEMEGHVCDGGLSMVEMHCSLNDVTPCLKSDIKFVSEDVKVRFKPEPVEAKSVVPSPPDDPTDDPTRTNIWGIDRVDARSGLDKKYHVLDGGADVDIFILDGGINCEHDEFKDDAGVSRCEFGAEIDETHNCKEGWEESFKAGIPLCTGTEEEEWECITRLKERLCTTTPGKLKDCSKTQCDAIDVNGHGTHCAGTAAGKTYGIAKAAKLFAVQVTREEFFHTSGFISGMNYVGEKSAARNRRAVASVSLGWPKTLTMATNDAVRQLVENDDVVVVVAAGNEDSDACKFSPASARQAITVGATSKKDTRDALSNFGDCVDIWAPGVRITSAYIGYNNTYAIMTGTSMACPHVAGGAALILNRIPDIKAEDVAQELSRMSTKDAIGDLEGEKKSVNEFLYVTPPPR